MHTLYTLYFEEKIKYLTLTDASKVWMPDTFFRNEKIGNFHNILTPNLYIRVYPDGDVLYSIRYIINYVQRIFANDKKISTSVLQQFLSR